MPAFSQIQNEYFHSSHGAFSPVSELDEANKAQITCTGFEYEILIEFFQLQNIHVGAVGLNRALAEKSFYNDNVGKFITLPLTFPKAGKNELRLYMRKGDDFYPNANQIWYLYKRNNEDFLHIGFIDPTDWEILSSGNDPVINEDIDDEIYQNNLQNVLARMPATTTTSQYPRSSAVAKIATDRANGLCEVDNTHETFVTSAGSSYIEAHHLMPISQQQNFEYSLDHPSNIVIMCPNCHRKIHYGSIELKLSLIEELYQRRRAELGTQGINYNFQQLKSVYKIP
ncbi:MAG: hypothetical protein HOP07_10075 [Bacteriovoracaceae bacterium]|nr:hypothetical protein [Bacteriovoracaceae bacterium]